MEATAESAPSPPPTTPRRRRARLRTLLRATVVVAALIPVLAWFAWEIAIRVAPFDVERLRPGRNASVVVLDHQGEVLRETASAAGGRERWAPLRRISPHLVAATVISEDGGFREHRGVDPMGIVRALWLDLKARRLAYGGSTLTMQLVKLLDREPRSLGRKLHEAVEAGRLERTASKDEILEQYLNRVYYGNGAWGAESAARLYFDKSAHDLSLGEAAMLATLPRGPRAYDPARHLDAALARRHHILGLMAAAGVISAADRDLAERTPLVLRFDRPGQRAPHFVDWVLSRVPAARDGGVTVQTTLDGPLQRELEVALDRHLDELGGRKVGEAGLLVLRHRDGAVLAMVGSRDYHDAEDGGATNVTVIRRRPGSTLKPFVYGLALERGDTPASIAYDVILTDEQKETWTAGVRQHGPARYRESLAGSYNLAAIHTLQRVGVGSLVERLQQAGITTLDRTRDGAHGGYDPALAIGDAEVRLIELASAYAAFGNGGRMVPAHPIVNIEGPRNPSEHGDLPPRRFDRRVFSPQVAWLVWHMLSDPDARRPMFGGRAPVVLPFPVALKTGTTRAYTDNLAFGVTGEYTVAAWAGNFDGTPTDGVMAMRGAAPLVRAAFVALAARYGDPAPPPRPEGIEEASICPLSGERPGPDCASHKSELFLAGTAPTNNCSWHVPACGARRVRWPAEVRPFARFHGLDESAACPALLDEVVPLRIAAPSDGARFQIDPERPLAAQRPPLHALPAGAPVVWRIDGLPPERFVPSPGDHHVTARLGHRSAGVTIHYE